jgi:hypothetical protein
MMGSCSNSRLTIQVTLGELDLERAKLPVTVNFDRDWGENIQSAFDVLRRLHNTMHTISRRN